MHACMHASMSTCMAKLESWKKGQKDIKKKNKEKERKGIIPVEEYACKLAWHAKVTKPLSNIYYMYYNLSSSQTKSETLASKVYQVQAFTMKPE